MSHDGLPGAVHRIMGIETEYGIAQPGSAHENPMLLSSQIVNAYANTTAASRRRTRWDYEDESPLRDARGYDLDRESADSSQLTDIDMGFANVVLGNGARYYVDHAHPEYSGPECTNPRDVVKWDLAGDEIMRRSIAAAVDQFDPLAINIYKNNTDNKGASYGTHENYIVSRGVPFGELVTALTPFFITRQIMVSAGRVGIGQSGTIAGFQISQRADFFEAEVGLETTLRRPIINTRDEPHADAARFRRLHVIIGDANLSQPSTYLKVASTSLVLALIEAGALSDIPQFRYPVVATREVSHDLTMSNLYEMQDGRRMTALNVQEYFLESSRSLVARAEQIDESTADVIARWSQTLEGLLSDDPALTRTVEWRAKLDLLNSYRQRDHIDWGHPRLALIDLQWSDIRKEKGIFYKIEARGLHEVLIPESEVLEAVSNPPDDTRAYLRGRLVERFPENVVAASWDSLLLEEEVDAPLVRVSLSDPYRATRGEVGDIFEKGLNARELLERLKISHRM
ncbi:unannotated protein [freshwater metagenome]|uniref:Unannotated protein n=1 Tax=freshwater metagenome TaxID=449393 RepID=A0A6J7BAZ4_9ZZZZ